MSNAESKVTTLILPSPMRSLTLYHTVKNARLVVVLHPTRHAWYTALRLTDPPALTYEAPSMSSSQLPLPAGPRHRNQQLFSDYTLDILLPQRGDSLRQLAGKDDKVI